jgi:type IV pilus assembly protein PilW
MKFDSLTRKDEMTSRVASRRGQLGFSLVELMVALALGVLLIGGVLSVFSGTKATYQANETLARVQENVRFALSEMQFNSRGATSLGFCGTRPEPAQWVDAAPGWQDAIFGAQRPIMGWEFDNTGRTDTLTIDAAYPTAAAGAWSTQPRQIDGTTPELDLPALFSANATIRPVADSDIFITRNLVPVPGTTWDGSGNVTDATLNLTNAHGLADGDLVYVTDCIGADFFRNRGTGSVLSRATGGGCDGCPGNINPGGIPWGTNLTEAVQVYRAEIWAYFVGFNTDRDQPGLYRMDLAGCPCGTIEEIVEGVENMQLLYGYSQPAPAGDGATVQNDSWLTADQIEDWWPVISARVSILQRSSELDGAGNIQREFNLAGTFITSPLDSRMRHDASTTLALRNRIIVDD